MGLIIWPFRIIVFYSPCACTLVKGYAICVQARGLVNRKVIYALLCGWFERGRAFRQWKVRDVENNSGLACNCVERLRISSGSSGAVKRRFLNPNAIAPVPRQNSVRP
jgi:hypothetical protein